MGIIFVILLITPTVTWHFVIYVTVGNDSNPAKMEGIITPILSLRRPRFKAVSMQLGDQKLGVRKGVVLDCLTNLLLPELTYPSPQLANEPTKEHPLLSALMGHAELRLLPQFRGGVLFWDLWLKGWVPFCLNIVLNGSQYLVSTSEMLAPC